LDLTNGLGIDQSTSSSVQRTYPKILWSLTLACTSHRLVHLKRLSHVCHATFQCQAPRIRRGAAHVPRRQFGICRSRGVHPKKAWQASRPLVYRVPLPPPFRSHSCCYGILIAHFRIITYMLLFRYTSFRSDDMKNIVRQTTERRINLLEQYWKSVSRVWVISSHLFRMLESASLTLSSGTPQQRASFARCSSQTPHVASLQRRHLPTRDLRASQH
jgi:hypothetical protein